MKLKVASWVEPTIDHLWSIRNQIIKDEESDRSHLGDIFGFYFGYPDYAGLPEKIHTKIPESVVNIIHKQVYYIIKNKSKNKNDFIRELLNLISNNTIII